MCGIFGQIACPAPDTAKNQIETVIRNLFLKSETRGKEASGFVTVLPDSIPVIKSPQRASKMIRSKEFSDLMNRSIDSHIRKNNPTPLVMLGHSRLVTTGSRAASENNQPVIRDNCVGVHNGIIVNHKELWQKHPELTKTCDVDSEIIFALLRNTLNKSSQLATAITETYQELYGVASIACVFNDLDKAVLATNNGSLYYSYDQNKRGFIFASESHILRQAIQLDRASNPDQTLEVTQLLPGEAIIIDYSSDTLGIDLIKSGQKTDELLAGTRSSIRETHCETTGTFQAKNKTQQNIGLGKLNSPELASEISTLAADFPYDTSWSDSLRRCTRCILNENMPFVAFNEEGVCNYCTHYSPITIRPQEELLHKTRHLQGISAGCIVGASGGRDSLYSLHYIKTVLNLQPVAFTYDWGMVTDLARRNISRVCAKLGVEHIIVSADIDKKRRNIARNVNAWLKKPELGMIPLFMAGDKQYFHYLKQVQSQTGAELAILGENMLEQTHFKTGFAGVRPFTDDPNHVYTLPLSSKFKLLSYYGKEILLNPSYINLSIFDSAWALGCYYMLDRQYLNLFNYVPWKEDEVIGILTDEYDFERQDDTTTTWRIGDGTAAFYNYIFYLLAGFTEHDTFRSNQIREGLLDRQTALTMIKEENKPRYESIIWYLETIGCEHTAHEVLSILNRTPRVTQTRISN
jgi:predicted glutamine amidotransferase